MTLIKGGVDLRVFTCTLGPISRKARKLFGPEKQFVKLRSAYSAKLVFSYVIKGIKIKINAKFRSSRQRRFQDTKRFMLPEMRPKSLGTFEKRAPGNICEFDKKCAWHHVIFLVLPSYLVCRNVGRNCLAGKVSPSFPNVHKTST